MTSATLTRPVGTAGLDALDPTASDRQAMTSASEEVSTVRERSGSSERSAELRPQDFAARFKEVTRIPGEQSASVSDFFRAPTGVSSDTSFTQTVEVAGLSRALGEALSALLQVIRGPEDPSLWQDCARRLRAATAVERNRSRRHAALALLLADVLSFTQPDDLREPEGARRALTMGWQALGQPFVSTDSERAVTRALARSGWQLTLPYTGWGSKQ